MQPVWKKAEILSLRNISDDGGNASVIMCDKRSHKNRTVFREKSPGNFWETFISLREDPTILKLKNYPNHKISNLFDHSSRVALCAYDLSRRLHIKVNGESLAKGAMLHDFYLYQASGNKEIGTKAHWFGHPDTALKNAEKEFQLTELERNIIISHMWPLNFWHVPRSREAVLVCLADKICAFGEGVLKRNYLRNAERDERAERRKRTGP